MEQTYRCEVCGAEKTVQKNIGELNVSEWCNHNRAGFSMFNAVKMKRIPAYTAETDRVMRNFVFGSKE